VYKAGQLKKRLRGEKRGLERGGGFQYKNWEMGGHLKRNRSKPFEKCIFMPCECNKKKGGGAQGTKRKCKKTETVSLMGF